jgi:hypothetical protein
LFRLEIINQVSILNRKKGSDSIIFKHACK